MTARWRIQVLVDKGKPTERWSDVRPTRGKPYEYDTQAKAVKMARLCYGSYVHTDPVVRVYRTPEST